MSKKRIKWGIEKVKQYFKDHNCELLEKEYKNAHISMKYRCDCGNEECKICFNNFQNGQRCMECKIKKLRKYFQTPFEEVKQYFKDHNCKLLETEYKNANTPMKYECSCGNSDCKITFGNFKEGKRCIECSGSKKYTFEEVKQYFEDHGCLLLETEYINANTPMKYECSCENSDCKITFSHFKNGERCMECGIKKRSGKNHWNYNPNITDEEREKRQIRFSDPFYNEWRKKVFGINHFTCGCCGKIGGKMRVHHIEGFAENKELRLVVSNGFLFCREHHLDYHKQYGYKNINRKQLNEYLEKYQKNIILISIINGVLKSKIN